MKRAMDGLQHLGQSAEDPPVKVRFQWEHVLPWNEHILGVRAVEVPSHPAHHRCDYHTLGQV